MIEIKSSLQFLGTCSVGDTNPIWISTRIIHWSEARLWPRMTQPARINNFDDIRC